MLQAACACKLKKQAAQDLNLADRQGVTIRTLLFYLTKGNPPLSQLYHVGYFSLLLQSKYLLQDVHQIFFCFCFMCLQRLGLFVDFRLHSLGVIHFLDRRFTLRVLAPLLQAFKMDSLFSSHITTLRPLHADDKVRMRGKRLTPNSTPVSLATCLIFFSHSPDHYSVRKAIIFSHRVFLQQWSVSIPLSVRTTTRCQVSGYQGIGNRCFSAQCTLLKAESIRIVCNTFTYSVKRENIPCSQLCRIFDRSVAKSYSNFV